MPKRAKMRLTGKMYVVCQAPIKDCSTVNHTCRACAGSQVIVIQMDQKGRVTAGPAATNPLKFDMVARNFRVQENYSHATEWGHRHIEGKVYRRRTKRRPK